MSFATPKSDTLGHRYDSKAEARVGEALWDLRRERIVADFLVHPRVMGVTADFLVQFGKETDRPGRLTLLEYDGLAERRPEDLEPKLNRYATLREIGLDVRWLFEESYEAVRACLTDYSEPPVVVKVRRCECGHRDTILVHSPGAEKGEITGRMRCGHKEGGFSPIPPGCRHESQTGTFLAEETSPEDQRS